MFNALRTTLLLAALTGLFMAIGLVVGGFYGMLIALAIATLTNAISYWNADKLVLRLQNATPITRPRAPELFDIIATLAGRAGLPMPRIYLIDTDQPNAFATGRNPENAAIAVSRGLIQQLEHRELAAVLAHELAHIRSRDTLTMTLSATLAGAITMLAQFGLFFGGRNGANPVGAIGSILTIILAPLAAILVQMAVSRTREYEADRDGAEISGDPLALASALDKISHLSTRFENPWARRFPGVAHLYIVNPLFGDRMDNLFSTHPDVRNRIEALRKMAREQGSRRPPEMPPHRPRHTEPSWRTPSAGRGQAEHAPEFGGPWG